MLHTWRAALPSTAWPSGAVNIDMRRVKQRKDEISGRSYHGHAQFESPRAVRVNAEILEAGKIFINVGGRALVPPMPGLDQVPYLTNSSIMELDYLPEHLLIIGGSYIGLEFAQMYRRFGSRVTVIEMGPRLIGREDEDVSAEVQAILEREGIEFRLNSKCLKAGRD